MIRIEAGSRKALAFLFGYLCFAPAVRAGDMPSAAEVTEVRVGGTGAALGLARLLGEAYGRERPGIRIVAVQRLGSPGGIRAVLDGAIDLGFISRPLRPDEQARGASVVPLGRTPFVIIANPGTAVAGLTLGELARLVRLERRTWDDDMPVRVVFRSADDSDSRLLAGMSVELGEALGVSLQRPGIRIAATDQDAADQVERMPGAIGTSSLALVLTERRNVNVLPVDGMMPSLPAMSEGRYPWSKRIWVVSGPHTGLAARAFARFLQSPEAAQIMAAHGLLADPPGESDGRPGR